MGKSKIVDFQEYVLTKGKIRMCMEVVEKIQENRKNKHVYTLAEMKGVAEEFLDSIKYNGEGAVPIIKIAQECGFVILYGSMVNSEMSGFVSVDKRTKKKYDSDKIIGINSNDELGHQRFVIAHELAHYLFDYNFKSKSKYRDNYIKNSHKSLTERIANTFAANLLMPAKYFVLRFDEDKSMDKNIKDWTNYFEVQERAVEKRVIEVIANGI